MLKCFYMHMFQNIIAIIVLGEKMTLIAWFNE